MAVRAQWDESKYKRHPEGSYNSQGGRFAEKPDYHDGGKDREKAIKIAEHLRGKARPIDPEGCGGSPRRKAPSTRRCARSCR